MEKNMKFPYMLSPAYKIRLSGYIFHFEYGKINAVILKLLLSVVTEDSSNDLICYYR